MKMIIKCCCFGYLGVVALGIYYINTGWIGADIEFGSGQYYYTDIPKWQEYFMINHYSDTVSLVILIFLFFLWGFLMYKLWIWVDKKIGI